MFYAFSAWAFSVGIGPSNIIGASQEFGPDLMFVFMGEQTSVIFADIMTLLFITSLFAALQSFHNSVARYFYSLGRERVLPRAFARTSRAGAPWSGSVAQTAIAALAVTGFALGGDVFGGAEALGEMSFLYPVLTMFTWLTNTGAAGLVLLMAVIAAAVIGFFRKNHRGLNAWTRIVAPVISGIALLWAFILILMNFQLMLGQAEPDATTFILPGLIFAAGLVGVVWGLVLKASKPDIYQQIGHGTEPGAYDTELVTIPEQ